MKTRDIPFDVKMKVIRSYLCGFWLLETVNDGMLEARLDKDGYTMFVGDFVYINELIDEVYEHLKREMCEWCGFGYEWD